MGVKGEANSLAAAQLGLEKTFKLNGHQAAYLALGDDEPSQQLLKKLEGVSFLVVQASYISPLTAIADVVLPVGNWMEQDGHYLSLEGRLQEAHQSIKPAEDILSNEAALQAVAKNLRSRQTIIGRKHSHSASRRLRSHFIGNFGLKE